MVFAIVVVGGITRLTESGLSITEWDPLLGIFPPLNAAQWQAAFDSYKAIPQYHAFNTGMTLEAFKQIVREQYFSLVLDPDGALAAIPAMLPPGASERKRILAGIHRMADADGTLEGDQAQRLAYLEKLFQSGARAVTAKKAPRKAIGRRKA